jgi:hypothetical protein
MTRSSRQYYLDSVDGLSSLPESESTWRSTTEYENEESLRDQRVAPQAVFFTTNPVCNSYLGRTASKKAAQPEEFASARLMPVHQQQDWLGCDVLKPVKAVSS